MGIPHATMVQIQQEGIQSVADLADFDEDSIQQLADNLRECGGRIPDPDPNAAEGTTIPTPAFTYGAKSQKQLTVACDLIRYYQTVGRDLTAANIQWNQVNRSLISKGSHPLEVRVISWLLLENLVGRSLNNTTTRIYLI